MDDSRNNVSISFTAFTSGLIAEVGDVIDVTYDRAGWTNKFFRVNEMTIALSGEVGIVATEYADIY